MGDKVFYVYTPPFLLKGTNPATKRPSNEAHSIIHEFQFWEPCDKDASLYKVLSTDPKVDEHTWLLGRDKCTSIESVEQGYILSLPKDKIFKSYDGAINEADKTENLLLEYGLPNKLSQQVMREIEAKLGQQDEQFVLRIPYVPGDSSQATLVEKGMNPKVIDCDSGKIPSEL